jgi:hypothetical protein
MLMAAVPVGTVSACSLHASEVGGLPDLGSVRVELPVVLLNAEARQLKMLVEDDLPAWLQPGFHVTGSGRTFQLKVGNCML